MLVIAADDPRAPDVQGALEAHLAFARRVTPPEGVFALGIDDLLDPAVTFVSARVDGRLVGIGALKRLDESSAEVKSMHTLEGTRGRGVGRAIVDHLLSVALGRGLQRVSLETGSMEAFAPARALYAAAGFTECGAFGTYESAPTSTYMTIDLRGRLRPLELWHNPSCSKSRAVKAILDDKGVAYVERRYVDDPPTVEELDRVLTALDLEPWKVARLEEPVAAELGLKTWPHDEQNRRRWIEAMVSNPILIERPILVADDGRARLGRPPEAVEILL